MIYKSVQIYMEESNLFIANVSLAKGIAKLYHINIYNKYIVYGNYNMVVINAS